MVELKSGETYNGTIKAVDKFTNIKMEAANLSDKVHPYQYRVDKFFTVLKKFTLKAVASNMLVSTMISFPRLKALNMFVLKNGKNRTLKRRNSIIRTVCDSLFGLK